MPNRNQINPNDFSDKESIYKNINVEIFKTKWKSSDLDVVIKNFFENNSEFQNEFNIISNLRVSHLNIITFYGCCSDNHLNLVFEYADQGNLREYLDKFDCLTWNEKIKLCKDITHGLYFLHNCDVIHKDIWPKNILISQ
ncbi:27489_t:CDS:1, partial [Dentiscutata erythropus]